VVLAPLATLGRLLLALEPRRRTVSGRGAADPRLEWAWQASSGWAWTAALAWTAHYVLTSLSAADMVQALGDALITMLRVIVLIALASLSGCRWAWPSACARAWPNGSSPSPSSSPPFPPTCCFPLRSSPSCGSILPDVWLSPLMILGTQWYILFNVIAGASAIPNDLREAAGMFGVRGWQWWRQVALPGIFPYYVTGALTASGGSWNASIVAEAVTGATAICGPRPWRLYRRGHHRGNYPQVALGIGVMSLFVLGFNRLVWRPLYAFGERRLRL
jgi:NitT/TauT family transport system permease protein